MTCRPGPRAAAFAVRDSTTCIESMACRMRTTRAMPTGVTCA